MCLRDGQDSSSLLGRRIHLRLRLERCRCCPINTLAVVGSDGDTNDRDTPTPDTDNSTPDSDTSDTDNDTDTSDDLSCARAEPRTHPVNTTKDRKTPTTTVVTREDVIAERNRGQRGRLSRKCKRKTDYSEFF